ncbi:hypothetical protein BGZ99_004988, partial [Dissophora globulifera]
IITVGYQCLRGVILIEGAHAISTTEAGKKRARQFMRELVPFVVTTIVVKAAQEAAGSGVAAGPSRDNTAGMQVIEEGIQVLKSLAVASVETARRGIVSLTMSTVVPLLLVPGAVGTGKAGLVHALALNSVLALGTQFPAEFRQGLATLSVERRARLESAIRQSVQQQQEQRQQQQEREQREQERLARERDRVRIELKSSFAGFT